MHSIGVILQPLARYSVYNASGAQTFAQAASTRRPAVSGWSVVLQNGRDRVTVGERGSLRLIQRLHPLSGVARCSFGEADSLTRFCSDASG